MVFFVQAHGRQVKKEGWRKKGAKYTFENDERCQRLVKFREAIEKGKRSEGKKV